MRVPAVRLDRSRPWRVPGGTRRSPRRRTPRARPPCRVDLRPRGPGTARCVEQIGGQVEARTGVAEQLARRRGALRRGQSTGGGRGRPVASRKCSETDGDGRADPLDGAGGRARRTRWRSERTASSGRVPWSRSRVSQASTAPGTAAARGPVPGTRSRPSSAVGLDRGAGGGGALARQDDGLPRTGGCRGPRANGGDLAAGAVEVRFDDLQGETRGDRGVEGVAAGLEDRHAGGAWPASGWRRPSRRCRCSSGRVVNMR